jgi:hypothetical protein
MYSDTNTCLKKNYPIGCRLIGLPRELLIRSAIARACAVLAMTLFFAFPVPVARAVPECLGVPATIVGTEGFDNLVGTQGPAGPVSGRPAPGSTT